MDTTTINEAKIEKAILRHEATAHAPIVERLIRLEIYNKIILAVLMPVSIGFIVYIARALFGLAPVG